MILMDSSFFSFQPQGLPPYTGLSPLGLHPSGLTANGPIGSGLHGAFQPKVRGVSAENNFLSFLIIYSYSTEFSVHI